MSPMLELFTTTFTETLRAKAHPELATECQAAIDAAGRDCELSIIVAGLKEIENHLAFLETIGAQLADNYADGYVKRNFKKTKSHPQPLDVFSIGMVWPVPDAELLEAFKRQGFQVTATNRVFATPTRAERIRCGVHFHNRWLRERLLRRYLQLCEELLGEANDE